MNQHNEQHTINLRSPATVATLLSIAAIAQLGVFFVLGYGLLGMPTPFAAVLVPVFIWIAIDLVLLGVSVHASVRTKRFSVSPAKIVLCLAATAGTCIALIALNGWLYII